MPYDKADRDFDLDTESGQTGHVANDLAVLLPGMHMVQVFRIAGTCEWQILEAISSVLEGTGSRLEKIRPVRIGTDRVEVELNVSDLTPAQAREIASRVRYEPGISFCHIEHTLLRRG